MPVSGGVENLAVQPRWADGRVRWIGLHTPDRRAHAEAACRGSHRRRGLPDVSRLTFTRDGSRLVVVAGGDSELCSISLLMPPPWRSWVLQSHQPASGRLRRLLLRLPGFALAPGRRSVVSASDQGELVWWDLETRKATRRLEIGADHLALALSPDGRTAAVGAGRGSSWSTRAPGRHARRPGSSAERRAGCSSARTARGWSRRASTGRSRFGR